MKSTLDCVPCLVRQGVEALRLATGDAALLDRGVRKLLRNMAGADLDQSPPVLARNNQREIRRITQVADPYAAKKCQHNRLALELLPGLEAWVSRATDPFAAALRAAIAGNVIDLGAHGGLTEGDVRKAIGQVLSEPFAGDANAFARAVGRARSILYLADNAGEIVFDTLLLKRLPADRTVCVVRGGPVLNDATLEDAGFAGIGDICQVMDNGSDAPGTVLEECGPAFLERFHQADLVIAKGQGNYETLIHRKPGAWFLFKVKCQVIATHAGLPLGTHALLRESVGEAA